MGETSSGGTGSFSGAGAVIIDTRGAFPDPRVKVFMAIALSTVLFMTVGKLTMFLVFGLAFAILLTARMYRTSLQFLAVYAVLNLVDWAVLQSGWVNVWTAMLGFFAYILMKFLPLFMMGSWLVATVKVNDFVMALENSGVPRSIIIPLAAMLRFMPTVKEEVGYIADTMKMRNIGLSAGSIVRHPLRTMEYVLVPLLLRSVKVADEIAAAALTRGIDRKNKRTSLRDVRITLPDVTVAAAFCLFMAGLWYCDKALFPGLSMAGL